MQSMRLLGATSRTVVTRARSSSGPPSAASTRATTSAAQNTALSSALPTQKQNRRKKANQRGLHTRHHISSRMQSIRLNFYNGMGSRNTM